MALLDELIAALRARFDRRTRSHPPRRRVDFTAVRLAVDDALAKTSPDLEENAALLLDSIDPSWDRERKRLAQIDE
jgi:hypothetical protein